MSDKLHRTDKDGLSSKNGQLHISPAFYSLLQRVPVRSSNMQNRLDGIRNPKRAKEPIWGYPMRLQLEDITYEELLPS
jgi:hypothetical protein